MTSASKIEWANKSGNLVTVEVLAETMWAVTIDGNAAGEAFAMIPADKMPNITSALKVAGCSHAMWAGGKLVGIPQIAADAIRLAAKAAVVPLTLKQQREELVIALAVAGDEWMQLRERAFVADRLDQQSAEWIAVRNADARMAAAQAALDGFDTVNPQIIAAEISERDARTQRVIDAD